MDDQIITINERGQLTIPKNDRDAAGTRYFIYSFDAGKIVLTPLQTRDEFLEEIEGAERDWKKKGGFTLEEMRKKHDI